MNHNSNSRLIFYYLLLSVSAVLEHGAYRQHTGLPRLQNNMKMVLKLGDQVEQPLPITATTYETFKAARRAGYGLASYGRPA